MELKSEQQKIRRNALAAAVFCALMMAAAYSILPRHFEFPVELIERLAFALRADVFVFFWVLLGVRLVAKRRFNSSADINGAAFGPPSAAIALDVAFLQNTLEQTVIAVGAHLALATVLSGSALSLIVASVLLFGIGRVTFLLGYRRGAGGRAFGMVTTALPTLAGYVFAIGLMIAGF